jgi:hypothetical protein
MYPIRPQRNKTRIHQEKKLQKIFKYIETELYIID